MTKHNPDNERIKREYFAYLKEAKRHSEPTVDAAAKALNRFEVYTKYRDFKTFHTEQAIAFKKHLAEQKGQQSGEKLSKATLYATLTQLKRFFQWLALATGLQVAPSVFRCRVFQSVRQGHAHRYGPAGTESADIGTDKARHPDDADGDGDRAPQPCPDRIHASDRRAGQRHCFDEAEACRPDRGLRRSRCAGSEDEIQQDLHHLLLSGGR